MANPGGASGSIGSPDKPKAKPNPNPGGASGTVGGAAPSKPANPGGATGTVGGPPVNAKPSPAAGVGIGSAPGQVAGAVGAGIGIAGSLPGQVAGAVPKPAAPAPTAPPAAPTQDQGALADLETTLADYGLGSLAQWAWNEHVSGKPDAQILLDMRQTDEYKARFPGMPALQASGQAINESQYISKEAADISLMRSYGLPDSIANDRSTLGNLIGNQVSTTELQSRLNVYQSAVQQAPAEARDYLQSQFGIGQGDLMSYFLNPSAALPDLQMKAQAAQIGGAAAQSGFGFLDAAQALRLSSEGVTGSQAQSGFSKIAGAAQLTQNLGDGTGSVDNNTLISGTFDQNAAAELKAQTVAAQRVAKFQTGGGFAANQGGVSGLGVGNQGFG